MIDKELAKYLPMVDFIADICGPRYEVVLHDLSTPENSVVAIRNNYISGREIGSPITDLALKILKQGHYKESDFISNYKGFVKEDIEVLASTYFIKNDNSELIGMICINNELSDVKKTEKAFQELMFRFQYRDDKPDKGEEYKERLGTSIVDLTKSLVTDTINKMDIPPNRMSMEEKVKLVHEIDKLGVFLLKGGAPYVAKSLNISEATIYRYLNKERNL